MILNPWIWDRSRAKSEKPLVSFEGRYFTAISFDFLSRSPEKDATNLGNFFILKSKKLWWTFDSLNWIHHLYPNIKSNDTSNIRQYPNWSFEVSKAWVSSKKNARRRISFTSWTLAPNGAHLWRSVRRGAGNATRLWPGEWNYHLSSGC